MPLDSLTYSPTPAALDADGEILMRAAEDLELYGWCQGRSSKGAATCLGQALFLQNKDMALRIHHRLGFESIGALIDWNDDPARTKAEVISRLRAAAQGVGR